MILTHRSVVHATFKSYDCLALSSASSEKFMKHYPDISCESDAYLVLWLGNTAILVLYVVIMLLLGFVAGSPNRVDASRNVVHHLVHEWDSSAAMPAFLGIIAVLEAWARTEWAAKQLVYALMISNVMYILLHELLRKNKVPWKVESKGLSPWREQWHERLWFAVLASVGTLLMVVMMSLNAATPTSVATLQFMLMLAIPAVPVVTLSGLAGYHLVKDIKSLRSCRARISS
jgi:hypothetical protein